MKVWDADKGTETLTLKGHTGEVSSVAFSPDGKRIVSGSAGQHGEGLGCRQGHRNAHPQGAHRPVTSVAFSPDGKRIVSGS